MTRTLFTGRRGWLSALPLLMITGVLAILATATLTNAGARAGGPREHLFDIYQRLAPAPAPLATAFHVVEIDAESIEKVGPWPWPRSLAADLAARAASVGAKGVLYVEPIDAPDPLSPETIGAFWLGGARDDALAEQLRLLPSTDALLGDALSQTNGAVAIDPGAPTRAAERLTLSRADASLAPWATFSSPDGYVALPAARPRAPIHESAAAYAQLTVSALPVDADGTLRAPPLIWSVGGEPTPLTALEAARLALGAEKVGVAESETAVTSVGAAVKSVSVNAARVPVDGMARLRLYWPQRMSLETTSAWRLLLRDTAPRQLAGKVVLIGLAADVGGADGATATARGELSRAAAHGLIAQQIASGVASARPAWAGYLEAFLVMVLGAAAIIWSQKVDFWRAFGVAAALSAFTIAGSAAAFTIGRVLIDPLPAALALFLGAFSVAGGRSIGAVLTDDKVRGNFKGALPEPTMQKLREEGASEVLDGAQREITVLACELSLSPEDAEKFADRPGDMTAMLASACAALRKALVETGGAVDQADGGKIYAYFNAPLETADHVRAGCSAALRLVESMDRINAELDAGERRDVQLRLAIGVAEGSCFVGPMGHGRANRYSAVGRPMETASFLRRQAAFYGPAIICDESVYRKTHHHFAFLELDRVRPRDAARPFGVFALVGNPFLKSSKSFRTLDEAHRQLLAAYREGDFLGARAHLTAARQSPGANIAVFDIYEARIKAALENGAPPDWENGAAPVTL